MRQCWNVSFGLPVNNYCGWKVKLLLHLEHTEEAKSQNKLKLRQQLAKQASYRTATIMARLVRRDEVSKDDTTGNNRKQWLNNRLGDVTQACEKVYIINK